MKQKVLLTGRPGCGKTTLIKRLVNNLARPAGGFCTEEIRKGGARVGFKLVTLDGREGVFAHIDFKTRERVGKDKIDLSALEPLIALPSSPGKVVPVREVEGQEIYQSYIGSSANPGYRDVAVVAAIVAGRRIAPGVSLDINPASRQALEQLIREGDLAKLVQSGARLHQTGWNGCLGMGQAPAAGRRSLRTVPRNFPGRSGAKEEH